MYDLTVSGASGYRPSCVLEHLPGLRDYILLYIIISKYTWKN